MATLKGQNFRIYVGNSVVGMATGCTCTLTNNTEDASHKDITGMASLPTVISKGWSVSVESLSVADTATLLNAIKNKTKLTVKWDESNTSNNQKALKAVFGRKGQAYLNDVTFNFNDRENSTKSLQFTGTGALSTIPSGEDASTDVPVGAVTKGQFVRLYLSNDNTAAPAKVIAAAKQLSLHVSMTLESATTKDTSGTWDIQEPTAINYDISTTALMRSDDTITSSVQAQALADIEAIFEAGTPVKWAIANASGDNQRTKGAVIASGSVIVTTLTLNGPNRQNADYTAALTGYGDYTVAA